MEHNQGQDWAKIPKHLLDLILEKLKTTVDALQFGVVCDAWNCTIKDNYAKVLQTKSIIPMLVVPKKNDEASVYDIVKNKFLKSKLEIPFKKRFAGSSRGWLGAVNEDWSVTLYKPFSRDFVRLPSLFPPDPIDDIHSCEGGCDPWSHKDYHIRKLVITAENLKECIVFVIYGEFMAEELAFIRPHRDSTWTKILTNVSDIVQYGNRLYMGNRNDEFYSLNLMSDSYLNLNSNLIIAAPKDIILLASVKRYLVVSCHEKLYQVKRYFDFRSVHDHRVTKKFEVHALDSGTGEWIEITNLRDEALFLGDNSSISINTRDCVGCLEDCIYFTHDYDTIDAFHTLIFNDVGVYHLQTKEFRMHLTIDPSNPPIWIVPTFNHS